MYYRILSTLALSFVFYIGTSQLSYHRLYETTINNQMGTTDTIFYHMSSTTVSGDVYAMGTKRVNDPTEFDDLSIIFTKHSDKGNIDWSKELDFGTDTVDIKSICEFKFNGAQDSILFAIDIEINGDRKEVFGRLDNSGNELVLHTIEGFDVNADITRPQLAPFINQSDLFATPGVQNLIGRIGLGDDLLWSKSYEFVNSDGDTILNGFTDMNSTLDSTIIATGIGSGPGNEFVVVELDSNGVQLWAESYTFPLTNLINISPKEVIPLNNGNFAVIGDYTLSPAIQLHNFVTIVDTMGSILLSKELNVADNTTSLLNVLQGGDGTLWISGTAVVNDTSTYFTTNMDFDGLINWTTYYRNQEPGLSFFSTSLLPVPNTGGATLVGHGFKDDLPVMQVMKHDGEGMTPCSDTITTIVEDLMIMDDTLISQVEDFALTFDTLVYEFNNFNGFSPPTLSIVQQYPPFCPNEVIDTFLIATVSLIDPENITYLWSTGEITDSIRVFMEGQYSVTVTISEDVCFSMCDTIELTRLTLPEIDISQDNSRFCLEQIIVLTGNYTPGAQGETYLWNTGAVTPTIEVTEAGVYSVTVVDECGEMASDDLDVSLPEFDPSVFFGSNTTDFCDTNSAILTAAYSGGGNNPTYTWSNGQMGDVIIVDSEGEYTVSVEDECGFMASATDNVMFPIIATDADISFTPNCNEDNNLASTAVFEAASTGDGEIQLAIFTIGADGSQTLVSQTNPSPPLNLFSNTEPTVNRFVVFARDFCGEILDSLSISGTAICGGLLQYPIAFFPGGNDDGSRTFGPIPSDTMDVDRISNVEFKVFNRWGETVFESNAILEAWDGTHKGEPAPSEVYIWYVSYMFEGQEVLDKGDVTLIR